MTTFTKNRDYLALLAGIVAHPDDDLRRLVFADWLEEHGDADRAEFIRLQVREAQLEHDDPERSAISQRTSRLFRTNGDRWRAELPRLLRNTASWSYQRGFLYKLDITAAKFLKLPKHVLQRNPITYLYLKEIDGQLDAVLANPQLANLRTVFLVYRDIPPSEADVRALATCPHLGGVRDLHVCGGGNELAAAVAECPSLTGMTYLDLYADIDDDGMAALTAPGGRNLRGLTRLNVRNHRFGSGTAEAIASSPAFAGLEFLSIGFNGNRDSQIGDAGAAALARSAHLGNLKILRLDTQGIGPDGVRALAAARHWPNLRVLSLRGNPLGAAGARFLAKARGLKLSALDLDLCELGDDGAAALATSDKLGGLVALDLEQNQIGVKGAVALSQSTGLAELVILNLNTNDLGDDGALALCESQAFPNLRRLHAKRQWGDYSPAVEAALIRRFTDTVFDYATHSHWPESVLREVDKARGAKTV